MRKTTKKRTPYAPLLVSICVLALVTLIGKQFFPIALQSNTCPDNELSFLITIPPQLPWWSIQSVDTMKYSRDRAREYFHNRQAYLKKIHEQTTVIATTGATHIAIDTPYDSEFLPVLQAWVQEARKNNLHIWFRGNFSGWEQWFQYPKMNEAEHQAAAVAFVEDHADLFADGDIFTSCPECENGGPGDPRSFPRINDYQKFLLEENVQLADAFTKLGVNVRTNVFSMNGDVAKLLSTPDFLAQTGNVVTMDHYVRDPKALARDVATIAQQKNAQVMLGEIGAPIPDIHGTMTAKEQAQWLQTALQELTFTPHLLGLNYWVSHGGSTALWKDDNTPTPAVAVLTRAFTPPVLSGKVVYKDTNIAVPDVVFTTSHTQALSDAEGLVAFPYQNEDDNISIKYGNCVLQPTSIQKLKTGTI